MRIIQLFRAALGRSTFLSMIAEFKPDREQMMSRPMMKESSLITTFLLSLTLFILNDKLGYFHLDADDPKPTA